jgi:hypothetical protein
VKKQHTCKENKNISNKINNQHKKFKKMLKTSNNCVSKTNSQVSTKMFTLSNRGVLKSKPMSNMIDLESAPIATI